MVGKQAAERPRAGRTGAGVGTALVGFGLLWACALLMSATIAHAAPTTSVDDVAPTGCTLQVESTAALPAAEPADIYYVRIR